MTKAGFRKRGIAALLMTLVTLGAVAAYITATASAGPPTPPPPPGHTIEGHFCLGEYLFCISAQLDGRTKVEGYGVSGNAGTCAKPPATADAGPQYCVPSETGFLGLTPGKYWFKLYDDQNNHNFELRSCPGSKLPCTASNPDATSEQELTDIATVYTAPVTTQLELKPGWYRLFCDSNSPVVHENAGMYIDVEVGGPSR